MSLGKVLHTAHGTANGRREASLLASRQGEGQFYRLTSRRYLVALTTALR